MLVNLMIKEEPSGGLTMASWETHLRAAVITTQNHDVVRRHFELIERLEREPKTIGWIVRVSADGRWKKGV